MAETALQIPWGWWGCDLGEYRPCSSTYQLYPYESLPPIDDRLLDGHFQWLDTQPSIPTGGASTREMTTLVQALHERGLTPPPSFVEFMTRRDLQTRVPSCTACEWDLSEAPIASPLDEKAVLVRFLRDQQDCLFWYLHLDPVSSAVVCSPIPFDEENMTDQPEVVAANTWWCAPTFENFVYRFWMENVLWFSLNEGFSTQGQAGEAGQAYLAHYAR